MTNEDIQKQFKFFAESDWNSQRIIYLDALEHLAAERDRADRAEARLAELERPRSLHLYADECTGGYFLAAAGKWEERTLHRFIQTVQSPRILSEATA